MVQEITLGFTFLVNDPVSDSNNSHIDLFVRQPWLTANRQPNLVSPSQVSSDSITSMSYMRQHSPTCLSASCCTNYKIVRLPDLNSPSRRCRNQLIFVLPRLHLVQRFCFYSINQWQWGQERGRRELQAINVKSNGAWCHKFPIKLPPPPTMGMPRMIPTGSHVPCAINPIHSLT